MKSSKTKKKEFGRVEKYSEEYNMAKNNGNNGKGQVEMVTRLRCAWNPNHVVEVDAVKTFLGNFKPGSFPDRWEEIEGEVLCEHCAEVAKQSLKQAREKCANNNGRKASTKN